MMDEKCWEYCWKIQWFLFVCQAKSLVPWVLVIVFLHKESRWCKNLRPHLTNKSNITVSEIPIPMQWHKDSVGLNCIIPFHVLGLALVLFRYIGNYKEASD